MSDFEAVVEYALATDEEGAPFTVRGPMPLAAAIDDWNEIQNACDVREGRVRIVAPSWARALLPNPETVDGAMKPLVWHVPTGTFGTVASVQDPAGDSPAVVRFDPEPGKEHGHGFVAADADDFRVLTVAEARMQQVLTEGVGLALSTAAEFAKMAGIVGATAIGIFAAVLRATAREIDRQP